MKNTAHADLLRQLGYLQEHGTTMAMLVVTVRNTSHGLIATIKDGVFNLVYPQAARLHQDT
jgi:hypothetical protein